MSHILSTISATFMSVVGPIFTITAPSASLIIKDLFKKQF